MYLSLLVGKSTYPNLTVTVLKLSYIAIHMKKRIIVLYAYKSCTLIATAKPMSH